MTWLNRILQRGHKLRMKEIGFESTLPENPTLADFKKEAHLIGQLAKEIQNQDHYWSDEHWKKISKTIEKLEDKP